MPGLYVYLPVYDLQLLGEANKFVEYKRQHNPADKNYQVVEVITRKRAGWIKPAARKLGGGVLSNMIPGSVLYTLAHGMSSGERVTGPEAWARSILSDQADYTFWKGLLPELCNEARLRGLADAGEGKGAFDQALQNEDDYETLVKMFAHHYSVKTAANSKWLEENNLGDPPGKGIHVSRPGALYIGGTRTDGTKKRYSATEFAQHLKAEGLPTHLTKLKLFCCNAGIVAEEQNYSFAEQVYASLKVEYRDLRVYGYLGSLTFEHDLTYAPSNGDMEQVNRARDIWTQFHGTKNVVAELHKGVRLVNNSLKTVTSKISADQYLIRAKSLRVEFPGGRTVKNQGEKIQSLDVF
jgi:hypothetical protein